MSQLDREGLISQSNFLFPDNTTREITPADLRTFNTDVADSLTITGSLVPSASYAVSASQAENANTSISASQADNSNTSISASHALHSDTTQEVIINVKNTSGVDLPKGTPVYATGVTGDNINIASASNDSSTTMPAIAVLGEALTNNSSGVGVVSGKIIGVNTDGFTAGRNIYVNTNGSYTQTKPTGTALIQNIGVVGKVNVTDGEIVIQGSGRSNDLPNIQNGYAWVGNVDQVPTAVSTASWDAHSDLTQLNLFTQSQEELNTTFATTGSNTFIGNQIISGSVITKDVSPAPANTFIVNDGTQDTLTVVNAALAGILGTSVTVQGNIAYQGNSLFNGNQTISGSIKTEVGVQGITSQTASIDFSDTSLFELTLGSGVDTHIDASNIGRGQTINVLITQDASSAGTVSFSPKFLQPSGSEYTATTTLSGQDILTFITYNDTSKVYVVATNKFE